MESLNPSKTGTHQGNTKLCSSMSSVWSLQWHHLGSSGLGQPHIHTSASCGTYGPLSCPSFTWHLLSSMDATSGSSSTSCTAYSGPPYRESHPATPCLTSLVFWNLCKCPQWCNSCILHTCRASTVWGLLPVSATRSEMYLNVHLP